MIKYIPILLLAINFQASANPYIIKPIAGKHYQDRNFRGKDWNENYLHSIGLGYRHESGIGAHAIYVNENSVNNPAWFIHAEYMYSVTDDFAIGAISGVRNGYPKKAENRTESDFIYSGALQGEYCFSQYCGVLQVSDRVAVINLKYNFNE